MSLVVPLLSNKRRQQTQSGSNNRLEAANLDCHAYNCKVDIYQKPTFS